MKNRLICITVFALSFVQAQESNIPDCLEKKIKKGKDDNGISYTALYLVEVEGKELYYLDRYIKPGNRPVSFHYVDENCEIIVRSSIGGIAGIKNYKPVKKLKKLWSPNNEPTFLKLKNFLDFERWFVVKAIPSSENSFKTNPNQMIQLSWRKGLGVLNGDTGKINYFKIIPKGNNVYNPETQSSSKSTTEFCNALLMEHDGGYWLLYSENEKDFQLIKSDKEGNPISENQGYALEIIKPNFNKK